MQIHYANDHLPEIPSPVVTMGSFDGVHAGHRVIISRLNHLAKLAGGASVLVTFHPHPRKVLYPEGAGKGLKLISTLEERCKLLEEAGLNHLVIMEFTLEFSRTTSEAFIEEFLVGKLHAHTFVVGFNHYFGHNKEGSYASLYRAREKYGFQVEEIPEQEIQNETVSSTKIRKALKEGHIQRANAYLEHHFLILSEMRPMLTDTPEGGPCFEVRVVDPDKLVPPVGSYAVSYRCGTLFCKGLLKNSGDRLSLYPLQEGERPDGGIGEVQFHKHLVFKRGVQMEEELEAVNDLIY